MSNKVIRAKKINGQLQIVNPKSIAKDVSSLDNINTSNNIIYRELSKIDAISRERRLTPDETYTLKELVACTHVLSKLEKDIIKNLNLEEMSDEDFLKTIKQITKMDIPEGQKDE